MAVAEVKPMHRRLVAALSLLSLVLLALPASAQRTTGTLVGVTKDDTGAVLPGVTVTLTGEHLVGSRSSVSNEQGLYHFAAIPPGTYNVTYTMPGFGTLNRTGVRVAVGDTSELNVSLKLTQRSEEITVTGEAPIVDTQGTQLSTNYDKDWVRNAPQRRFTFFDLINAAPGVSANTSTSSRSTAFGSNADENSYQLDGTDFTAPLTGAAWPWPNTDAIEEIQVLSLGAPAEYGGLQGAVFNVVTRQGSNAFHGDANFYYQSDGLTGNNTEDLKDTDGTPFDACPDDSTKRCPYHRSKFNDMTFQLSGPAIKDKLWFFGSYQHQRDADSQPGTDPNFPARSDADRMFFKLNYQINANHKLMFAYHDDFYRIPGRATANTAPSTIAVEHGHNPSPNLTYTAVLSDKTYIEARYSGFYGKDHSDPLEESEPRIKTRFYDLDTGHITGGVYSWYDGDSWKTAFSGKVSHFADNFLGGSHDFKFGVQYNSGGSDYANGYNNYIYTTNSPGYLYGYGYQRRAYHFGGEMNTIGAFLDDTFRVNSRLSLNLGLRYDHAKAFIPAYPLLDFDGNETGATSSGIDKLYTWNVVSPRVGFNLKLTNDGKTTLKAHYGRYYRGVVTSEFSKVGPQVSPLYTGLWDFGASDFDASTLEVVSDNTNQKVDPGYKDPYTDQFIAGFERELFKNLAVSLNYVYKKSRDYGAWKDTGGEYITVPYVDSNGQDATGQSIPVYQLVNDPSERFFQLTNPADMHTKYNGGSLQVTKRMSNHWQMVTSLVVSKSEGRLASAKNSPTSAQEGQARTFGQNPNDYVNTDGLLIADRPVVFKTQLVYELPKGFLVGANFTHQSGRPWGRQVRVSGLKIPGTTTIMAETIDGDRRVATWDLLDLRLQKDFGLGRGTKLSVFSDILNLFNDDANESILNRLGTSSTFGKPSRFLFPRRMMVGAKVTF
jgi:outer membrane receptor protein involved in Fe transport